MHTTPPSTAVSQEDLFQRSLSAHLDPAAFATLQRRTILVAGLGGGSNIAELLARKGFGSLILADPDVFEPHNIRQRGSLISTLGRPKVEVMVERLQDVNPHLRLTPVPEGITMQNVEGLVADADIIVEMLDFSAVREKVALHRAARARGRCVLTSPSVINGAVLYVFSPRGVPFEEFIEYEEGLPFPELGRRLLKRMIPRYAAEAPRALYDAAARGERTIPLDAVGVDQAAVLTVSAVENLALGRLERVVFAPRGIQIDVSDARTLGGIVDFSADFARP